MVVKAVPEISRKKRLIISPDAEFHQVPFELLIDRSGKRLLESQVISYIPSGSVLLILRQRELLDRPGRPVLAISASLIGSPNGTKQAAVGTVSRGVYDADGGPLPPLPSADDEARFVGTVLTGPGTKVLLGQSATERELKQQPLSEFRVLHFAAHGIVSTKYPARSALVLLPGDGEDGLLQAREILMMRLRAELVTLSACETGSGDVYGQEGVASLVRPFIAAGAQTVVANLWSADDTFSLALMREFYRQLSAGRDKGESLRQAKLSMIRRFGPQAIPRLWAGVVLYGDSVERIVPSESGTH
jgi:CHAT domain-containing protein